MTEPIWLLPALPLAGSALLLFFGRRLRPRAIAAVGCGSVGATALLAFWFAVQYMVASPANRVITGVAWSWFEVGGLGVRMSFRLDGLSLVMVLVVAFVGFLIHLYSAEFMSDDKDLARFFTAMNLFIASMLVLVLADNLVLLYLGWEGVGLCSYLLIGFWYTDEANGRAARKAFVVTRIGDTALAVGLFLIFDRLGTLDIQLVATRAAELWPVGSGIAVITAALVLAGAVGKSAQLPLQTWLPDAMAGPTPVSALIHAATMVTAGVYLIARLHVLFELAPPVAAAVALIGAATLVMAGFAALAQRDIKRVLAYSTISQIGYMFLALGVGAWSAAIFHLVTHAFFKALLFLAAGVVIQALDHEHDIHRMGGLAPALPVTFWTFTVGAAALSGLPLVTAGFYSKGAILSAAWSAAPALWAFGAFGALLTAVYIFRVVFMVFLGTPGLPVTKRPRLLVLIPLVLLAVLSLTAGFLETPPTLGHIRLISKVVAGSVPPANGAELAPGTEALLEVGEGSLAVVGVAFAWLLFGRRRELTEAVLERPAVARMWRLWADGWGFDALYDQVLVRPYTRLAALNRKDLVDRAVTLPAAAAESLHRALSDLQDGRLRRYAAWIAAGAVLAIAMGFLS